MTGSFSLEPSARVQRYLGRELIADPNLAVIEFVKNAYDAGASQVVLDFQLAGEERALIISDDGIGMSLRSFEQNWMRPGFSEKSPETPTELRPKAVRSAAGRRRSDRTPLGEKGLGRLASGRLGDVLEVYSRTSVREEWLHVTFDWRRFEDMTKAMSEVPIPYDHESPPFDAAFKSGTIILIRHLRLKWEGRVPGRPVAGRSRSRLGRLKQDLGWLLRPLPESETEFAVEIRSDLFDKTTDLGVVSPSSAEQQADYRFDFRLELDEGGAVCVARSLRRSDAIATELDEPRSQTLPRTRLDEESARRLERPLGLDSGAFGGFFLYDPPQKGKRAVAVSAIGHGVLLYRDGALVEPYGMDSDDWVGVEARKAQRQGHALIQPITLSGEVHISRDDNPALVDMANRQGLIDNDASSEFLAHVRAEFREFERLISPELERRHYKPKGQAAAESAEGRLAFARVRMRSVAHSLRQPLMGMTLDVATLRRLATRPDLPEDARVTLQEVSDSASEYVKRAEQLLSRLADFRLPEFEEVLAAEIVDAAIGDSEDAISRESVEVHVDIDSDRELVMPTSLVVDALAELIRNAAEAPRPPGRSARITVCVTDRGDRDVAISVSDNGSGLDGVAVGTPLSEIDLETKARPAGGLALVFDSLTIARGSSELIANTVDGSEFVVVLPGRLEGGIAEATGGVQ